MKDPEMPDEWQRVVNFAEAFLLLDSAKAYGLVTGGPVVNTARCEELLERGRAQGIVPIDADVQLLLEELAAHEFADRRKLRRRQN